jgi:hypothetical protein
VIYEFFMAGNFEWINAINPEDYEQFVTLPGVSIANKWNPIKVRRVAADKKKKNPSDFPWLGSYTLIMREKSAELLSRILLKNGELLPLEDEEGVKLFVFNANRLDALDEVNSEIQRVSSGNIMELTRPVFYSDRILGHDLFRLPHRGSPIYVTSRFIDEVYQAGLVGLEFKKVWPNEISAKQSQ